MEGRHSSSTQGMPVNNTNGILSHCSFAFLFLIYLCADAVSKWRGEGGVGAWFNGDTEVSNWRVGIGALCPMPASSHLVCMDVKRGGGPKQQPMHLHKCVMGFIFIQM